MKMKWLASLGLLGLCSMVPFIGKGQTTDSLSVRPWYSGIRVQVLGGAIFTEAHYRGYTPQTPTTNSLLNQLAGFNARPIKPFANGQVDYNVVRNSKKLDLYTGLAWDYNQRNYYGIKDSLLVYQLDTNILFKRGHSNTISAIISINGEKTLRFHTELGVVIPLFEIFEFRENANGLWRQVGSGVVESISNFRIYTSLGYKFKLPSVNITPLARFDYYPLYRLRLGLQFGLALSIQ